MFVTRANAKAQLDTKDAEIAELKKVNTQLSTDLGKIEGEAETAVKAATERATAAEAKAATATTEAEAAKAKLAESEKQNAALTAKLATFDETAINSRIEKAASAKALEITQKQGQTAPVPSDPPANPAAAKKEQSNLTGLARTVSAHQASTANDPAYRPKNQ